ncbi:MAG: gmr 1 [Acidobacteriaceae bacterium]|nr:gmr 1 [Acidobacteriaceae bacterium]
MNNLGLYRAVSSLLRIKYRTKIMLIAFAGTHVPLLALIFYFVQKTVPGGVDFKILVIATLATLGGTALTLTILNYLLQPIFLTARSLKEYAQEGILPDLPTGFTDEAGTLMADAQSALLKLDASLRRLTDFDQVTALPTRHAFMRVLDTETSVEAGLALCAMNVSNYDRIAAAFGQSAVNSVMVGIAARFRDLLGDEAPLSRVGTNIFVFTLDLNQAGDLASRVEAIRLAIESELFLPGLSLRLEVNAGVSLHPGGLLDAERLINEAISALAETHVESAIHTTFFSPQQNERARDVFLLERDIRLAIEQENFSVHYQPIIDIAVGRVVGAEALVRWSHPTRGMVSPLAFIPIAEQSGLMDAIGMRVLQQVCRQMGRWVGTPLENVKVSINLSARQFLNPDAVLQISDALEANKVSPHNLEIELTETTVIQDTERTLLILQVLRKMGITIAIDDFGTGYSGLSYLKTLPFDRLKIDREFIQNVDQTITSKAICKSLIELASGLGIEVLAEGTETAAEVRMMRSLGCSLYQGYHFARPLPADKFLEAVQLIEADLASQFESGEWIQPTVTPFTLSL